MYLDMDKKKQNITNIVRKSSHIPQNPSPQIKLFFSPAKNKLFNISPESSPKNNFEICKKIILK